MDNLWILLQIVLGIYLVGFALMFAAHLVFLMAFWGELRHSGHATWRTAGDIFLGSLLSGLRWPHILYQGYFNLRNSG